MKQGSRGKEEGEDEVRWWVRSEGVERKEREMRNNIVKRKERGEGRQEGKQLGMEAGWERKSRSGGKDGGMGLRRKKRGRC